MTTLRTMTHDEHAGTGVGGWMDHSNNYGVATYQRGYCHTPAHWSLGITSYCVDHLLDFARVMVETYGAENVRIVVPDGHQGDHIIIPPAARPPLRYR